MHAIWELILNKKFLKAYKHGIIIKCVDGISRRFYPRFLTYSADYPESKMVSNTSDKYTNHFIRVLLATIRYLGDCPLRRIRLVRWEPWWISNVEIINEPTMEHGLCEWTRHVGQCSRVATSQMPEYRESWSLGLRCQFRYVESSKF